MKGMKMKVQQVQPNLNFEAKKRRFIDIEAQEQLMQILRKMDRFLVKILPLRLVKRLNA